LCDTVRFSLTTEGLSGGGNGSPRSAVAEQENLLTSLHMHKDGDVQKWLVLRVKNRLEEKEAQVKCVLCNLLYTPTTDTEDAFSDYFMVPAGGVALVLKRSDDVAEHGAGCDSMTARAAGTGKKRPVVFADMVAHTTFHRTVSYVRDRDGFSEAVVEMAVRLLSHPSLARQSIEMVVEVQLYIPHFLRQRKLLHWFYKLARAETGVSLATDCAEHGAEGPSFRFASA
jgi:hypothetical protein